MEEEISQTIHNSNININNFDISNNNKYSLLNEIDRIINQSKIQLEEVQQKKQKDKNIYQCDMINDNLIFMKSDKNEIISEKENISQNSNNNKNDNIIDDNLKLKKIVNDKDFDLERIIQKLATELTIERVKVKDLNLKLKTKEKEISSLIQQIKYTQMNCYNKQNHFLKLLEENDKNFIATKNINNNDKEIKILSDKNNLGELNDDAIITKSFFEFFNKYIDLFSQLDIIKNNYDSMLVYIENDINNLNLKNANFAIKTFDTLIDKLIKDNKELYEQLMKCKENENEANICEDIVENNSGLSEIKNIENIKYENILLKNQLQKLIEDFKNVKSDNALMNDDIILNNNEQNLIQNKSKHNNTPNGNDISQKLNKKSINESIQDNGDNEDKNDN